MREDLLDQDGLVDFFSNDSVAIGVSKKVILQKILFLGFSMDRSIYNKTKGLNNSTPVFLNTIYYVLFAPLNYYAEVIFRDEQILTPKISNQFNFNCVHSNGCNSMI